MDVKGPILSVSRLMVRGIDTFTQLGKQSLPRSDGAVVALTRRGGLFVLQCQVVSRPMLLAPVHEEPAEGCCPLPVDEEMERVDGTRRGWHRQWHSSFRRLENHPVMSRGIMDSHTYRIMHGAKSASQLAREKRDMNHDHKSQPGTPVIQCDCCFLKTEEDAPMIAVLVAIDKSAQTDREKKETEFHSQVAVWPHSYDTSDIPKVIIHEDSEHALMAVVHDACSL